jgi:hypothetical protein
MHRTMYMMNEQDFTAREAEAVAALLIASETLVIQL